MDEPAGAKLLDDERFDANGVEAARAFLRHLRTERGLSDNTVRAYALDLRGYLDWAARGGYDPLRVGHRQFRRYLVELSQARYAETTISRRLSAVRSFFRYLNETGTIQANPAAAAASPKLHPGLPRKTAQGDVERLLSICDTGTAEGLRDQAFLELLYASGARISELAGLKVPDVDLDVMEVRLFGKGSKERIVPLHATAVRAVAEYLRDGRPKLMKAGVHDALFVSTRGGAMSADALRRVFKRRAAQAGLDPSLHPHDIRHAFATELVEGGADLRSVQEMLGHASLSTTQIYTHLSLKHMKDVYKQAHPRS